MPLYLCRWPNGDFSIVLGRNKEHAIEVLDEIGNAEGCPIRSLRDCLVNFTLTDTGELALNEGDEAFGEGTQDEIMRLCYPKLEQVFNKLSAREANLVDQQRPTPALRQKIRKAVESERTRVTPKQAREAQTERGREIAKQADMAASVIDRRVRTAATERLKTFDPKGPKH